MSNHTEPVTRPLTPYPPNFRKGSAVIFRGPRGEVVHGTFVRRFSPAPRAGLHYEIRIEDGSNYLATIMANGDAGLSVTAV